MRKLQRNFIMKGMMKILILNILHEKPAHGYDIMKGISERFMGLYEPSPGVVYPTLQLMEDEELITEVQSNGKKVYRITEKGEKVREEGNKIMNAFFDRIENLQGKAKVLEELEGLERDLYPRLLLMSDSETERVYRVLVECRGKIMQGEQAKNA